METSETTSLCRRERMKGNFAGDTANGSESVSSRAQKLLDSSSQDKAASASKFDEMMKRLKDTAATHMRDIKNSSTGSSNDNDLRSDVDAIDSKGSGDNAGGGAESK